MGDSKEPCVYAGCEKRNWRFHYCYPHANQLFQRGVLHTSYFGKPIVACSRESGCKNISRQKGLCGAHHEQMRREAVRQLGVRPCSWCKKRPIKERSVCAECLPGYMRNKWSQYRKQKKAVAVGDYDWVVVLNYWNGRPVDRSLRKAECVEIVRLILRSPDQIGVHATRMGRRVQELHHLMARYRDRAEAIGLEQPLRFCFLPEESLPSDVVLAS